MNNVIQSNKVINVIQSIKRKLQSYNNCTKYVWIKIEKKYAVILPSREPSHKQGTRKILPKLYRQELSPSSFHPDHRL